MGISQEQLTEAQAMFVKQSANTATVLSRSPETLRKASLDYVEMLVRLRDLTGMTVKESQDAFARATQQETYNAYRFSKTKERYQ